MWKPVLILLIASWMLTGCRFGTQQVKPVYPEAAMVKCEKREVATDGRLPALIRHHIRLNAQYDECAERHNTLIDTINHP